MRPDLSVSTWSFAAPCVMHRLTMEFRTVLSRTFAARRHRSMVALAIVEMMIDVSVKSARPVKPGSRTDEYTAREPFRSIISIRSAIVRRNLVVPVWANRRFSDADCNLAEAWELEATKRPAVILKRAICLNIFIILSPHH